MRVFARLRNLLKPSGFVAPPAELLSELHQEITESVNKAYTNPNLMRLYHTAPVRYLLESAIGFYVGSTSKPESTQVVPAT